MTSGTKQQRDPVTLLTICVLWLAMGVFVLYPIVRLLAMTFIVDGHLTFENLLPFLANWYDRRAIVNSIILACAVGFAGTIIGFIFAFAVTRLSMPKWLTFFISAVTLLPLISPPFTSSIALTLCLGPNGIILTALGLENFNFFGFWGTFISETLTYFPIAFMTLSTILMRIDPNLEDAAYSLGASPFNVFKSVTFPLSVPGLANAFLLLIPALAVYALQNFWVSRKSFVTVSGKAGGRSSIKGPGVLISSIVIGTVAFITAFVLYLYAIILVGSVVKVWGVDNSLTFENYHYVFTFGMKAIKDTLLIACIGTPLGGLLAVLIGYVCKWLKIRGHKTLETVSLLNYTLPGTVVGIAYIIAFNDQPLVLTGTVYILIAAYVFRYSSAGIRNVIAALTQIDPSIEEASTSLGASSAYTFRKITVPLVLPAVLTGMRYLFIHSMTAISATIFLVSVNWTLITTRILECMTELQFAQACAFSIVLILIVFAASAFMALMAKVLCPVGDASGGLR